MKLSLKTEEFNLEFEQGTFEPRIAIELIEVVSGVKAQKDKPKPDETEDVEELPIFKNLPPKLKSKAIEPLVSAEQFEIEEHPDYVGNRRKWFERGENVKVNFLCPGCSFVGVARTRWGNNYTKCPSCHIKAFNQPATEDGFGYIDNRGCAYKAEDMFLYPSERKEFENIFDESEGDDAW